MNFRYSQLSSSNSSWKGVVMWERYAWTLSFSLPYLKGSEPHSGRVNWFSWVLEIYSWSREAFELPINTPPKSSTPCVWLSRPYVACNSKLILRNFHRLSAVWHSHNRHLLHCSIAKAFSCFCLRIHLPLPPYWSTNSSDSLLASWWWQLSSTISPSRHLSLILITQSWILPAQSSTPCVWLIRPCVAMGTCTAWLI